MTTTLFESIYLNNGIILQKMRHAERNVLRLFIFQYLVGMLFKKINVFCDTQLSTRIGKQVTKHIREETNHTYILITYSDHFQTTFCLPLFAAPDWSDNKQRRPSVVPV